MNCAPTLARIICLLALALLSGCSAVKLGYNNFHELAYWWMDGYVDFSDEQAPRVREDLARIHQWHRGQELPRYVELLQKAQRLAPGEVTAAQACALVTEIRERLNVVADQAEPAVVTLALSLTPEQLSHLERKYARNNADWRKDWVEVSPADQKDKRFKQTLERSEMIYGSLDEAQRNVLRQQIEQSAFDARRILAERQRRQQDALQTLRKLQAPGLPLAEARSLMRGYLQRAQESPDLAYRTYQEALIQEGCRSFAATHAATTPAQRERAVKRLQAYQRDLRELAAQR